MGRDVGGHADRDTAGAVDEYVGKARGQHLRLHARPVIVRREIDGVLVDVLEQGHRDLGEPRLGVAHRGGRVGVHRSEIALAVDQCDAHRPILREAGERVVDRAVAVRVVVAHHVADDLGGFAIRTAGDEAAFLTGVENAAVDRLQAVADVWQRAADDHRHRIIEVGGLHLVDDRDRGDVAVFDGRRCAGQCSFLVLVRGGAEAAGLPSRA